MSQEAASERRRVQRDPEQADQLDLVTESQPAAQPKSPPRELTVSELQAYKADNLARDDDYTTELRMQVMYHGEVLLSRTKYEVELLEHELIALSTVFNEFLGEVKTMDAKISKLSTNINQAKMTAAQELDQTIKKEVQTVVDQLRLLPKADLDGVEILYQNLDALQDNFQVLEDQITTLDEIGIKTEHLKKNLPALERGLNQFGESIEKRQMDLLVGEETPEETVDYDALKQELKQTMQSQHHAMIKHLHQSQTLADPKRVELLKRNQAGFEKAYSQMQEQLVLLESTGMDVADLQIQLKPLDAGLKQFERALNSNQYLKFTAKIYQEVEMVNAQLADAQNCDNADDIEILHENVEVLFENCDAFADQIEELSDQGLDIDPIIEHYDVLRMSIEQFERAVQESANRIGLSSGHFAKP